MPLQNRVTPTGDIIVDPHRGLFTGNRGIIHDPATKTLLKRRWASPAWITCVCEFRGRRREVMGGRSWTELFFLDEATSFAAGHRPCFYLPPRRCLEVSRGVGAKQRRRVGPGARNRRRTASRAARGRQETIACAADAAGKAARRGDGAKRRGKLPDPAGPGAAMVAGGLSRDSGPDQGCHAVDAALDGAGVGRGLQAGAASERDGVMV